MVLIEGMSIKFEIIEMKNDKIKLFKGIFVRKTNNSLQFIGGFENTTKPFLLTTVPERIRNVSKTRLTREFGDNCRNVLKEYKKEIQKETEENYIISVINSQCKIVRTAYNIDFGETEQDGLFKALVIPEKIFYKLDRLKFGDMYSVFQNDIDNDKYDFVNVLKKGKVISHHITDLDSSYSIEEKGFNPNISRVGDLGKGVYTFLNTERGKHNVTNFFEYYLEDTDDVDVAKLDIYYQGKYYHCIYGEGHDDYLVLLQPKEITISDIIETDLYSI